MKLLITIIAFTIFALLARYLSNNNIVIFIYVALLLSLLVPMFGQSKKIIMQKLKYFIIWIVIFIIGFVVISYKDDLLNNRVTANLIPGRAQYNQKEIIFYAANDNHFYIQADINGHNIEFLLDTGASDIILSKRDAVKLGIDLNSLHYNKVYQTANGVVKAASVKLGKIMIGDLVFYNVSASINDGVMDTSLLGMSFLRLFSSYKFDANKVILAKKID